jgi:nitrogen-specific signal transduction histidine kinase/tetratricopeptide (TPR) repeat protein
MLENLRIAVKKQRKLIIIFFATVFIPALSLGIFGIRAIRNERDRQARQIENKHRRIAERLQSRVSAELRELESQIQNLAESTAFRSADEKAIADLVGARLAKNPLVDAVFYYYGNEEPGFPAFYRTRPTSSANKLSTFAAPPIQRILDKASDCEFKTEDFRQAIAFYRDARSKTDDKRIKAQALFDEARCLAKSRRYEAAVRTFERVIEKYPESVTGSGLPLAPAALLQTLQCRRALGDDPGALQTGIALYRDLIDMRWSLSEARFRTYTSLAEKAVEEILAKNQGLRQIENTSAQFTGLKAALQEKNSKWAVVDAIRQEIIPDLRRRQESPGFLSPIRFSKTIRGRLFLILASADLGGQEHNPAGLIGVKIREGYLLNTILADAGANDLSMDHTEVVISNLEGKVLLEKPGNSEAESTITRLFDGNFPPWRMEFFQSRAEGSAAGDLKSSFYVWTILTLVVVLVFGSVLIARSIGHEMEILKLKSDFVSSVSHEFKTPLTSIKALSERLQGEKLIDAGKMKQYFSLISQSADQLSRLVKNLLDFSRIEEGKLEYNFAPTDIGELVSQSIADFEGGLVNKAARVQVQISEDIPSLPVDRDALSQALNNLLDNAFKFSPAGAAVEVRVRKNVGNAIIEVADHGIGIPPDDLEKVFDKFYQGKHAVKQSAKGTGLGLTLVKHTAEAHGGNVSVKSRIGEGSTFTLTLPIREK